MSSIFDEKVGICYSCAGESYRESAVEQLENNYFDDDNLYFFIITDDKSYFKDVKRKNLIVNELKDFYNDFPFLEQYEALIDSTDKSDYAKKFVENRYLYSFSLMRFHLLQAYKENISNVALMCTDTNIDFNIFNNSLLETKNIIYNAISEWDRDISENKMMYVVNQLEFKYNLKSDQIVRVLDAAGRLFIFESPEYMKEFFDIWNEIIVYLFETNYIEHYRGSYVYHDEYILAPIYNVFNLNKMHSHSGKAIFRVNHNQIKERFWNLGSAGEGLLEHTDYKEFLRINNLQNG
jgi:hypothetical protein